MSIFFKTLLILLPIFMGVTAVIQNTFNRVMLNHWDIVSIVFLNGLIVFLVSGILLFIQHSVNPNSQSFFSINFNINDFRIWFVIPALTIILILFGMTFCLSKSSATIVFILFYTRSTGR